MSGLSSLGVQKSELAWFASYLQHRNISTTVNGVLSSPPPITSGVPQGSVLGPLLFILFFRDLPATVSSDCALFADDTLVYNTSCKGDGSPWCCNLQQDMDNVSLWAGSWSITFNASKSAHMVVRRRAMDMNPPVISLQQSVVQEGEGRFRVHSHDEF